MHVQYILVKRVLNILVKSENKLLLTFQGQQKHPHVESDARCFL